MCKAKISKNRLRRSCEELLKSSDAIWYEIWMLNEVADLLSSPSKQDLIVHNALVESFVLHARILIDFLYAPQEGIEIKPDTIIAKDYFVDEKWPPTLQDRLKAIRQCAHKLAAHLTYSRVDLDKKWQCGELRDDLNRVFKEFQKLVPQELVSAKLKNFRIPDKSSGNMDANTTSDAVLPASVIMLVPHRRER